MWTRWALGPVFALETSLNARRRQVYEARSFFVLIVLVGLIAVWFNIVLGKLGARLAPVIGIIACAVPLWRSRPCSAGLSLARSRACSVFLWPGLYRPD
jgi:hypothetical protein